MLYILPEGFEVENLAETFVIFITENDVVGGSRPIYHIERYIREYGRCVRRWKI